MTIYKNKSFLQCRNMTLILCIFAYTVSYFCRTNLSISLFYITQELSISSKASGFIGTAFFWSYAIGQLLCGWINSKINSKHLVVTGLAISTFCNLFISLSHTYISILLLWTLNGISLSLLWTPIVNIVSHWYEQSQLNNIPLLLNLPTTVGYIISWSILGSIQNNHSWRLAFFIPAVVSFIYSIIWLLLIKEKPESLGYSIQNSSAEFKKNICDTAAQSKPKPSLFNILFNFNMIIFAVLLICQGCIRESINLWAPTIMENVNPNFSILSLLIIPVFSTFGLILSTLLLKKVRQNLNLLMLILLILGSISGIFLMIFKIHYYLTVISLGIIMAILCSSTSILTTLVPLQFSNTGYVAKITGILNFTAYIGAATGGFLSGIIRDFSGLNGMYTFWGFVMILSLAMFSLFLLKHRNS